VLDAVVLAAGRGERFGGNKLSALLEGRPVLAHSLEILADLRAGGVIRRLAVVFREDASAIQSLARGCDADPLPVSEGPMSRSLQATLRWAAPDAGLLICLGDQPHLRPDVIRALIAAWGGRDDSVVRPRYGGAPLEPGHPVLLGCRRLPLLLQVRGDRGLAAVFTQLAVPLTVIDVEGSNPDVDQPSDLSRSS
jgi:molybdenum cofactor cytidylyltransferase